MPFSTEDFPTPGGGGSINPPPPVSSNPTFGGPPDRGAQAVPIEPVFSRRRRLLSRYYGSGSPAFFGAGRTPPPPSYATAFTEGQGYGAPAPQRPADLSRIGSTFGLEGGGTAGTAPTYGAGWGGRMAPAPPPPPNPAKTPINANPADPMGYWANFPGLSDITNPAGSDTLYRTLYNLGISNAGSGARRAQTAARLRGIEGLPYGVSAMEAERQGVSDTAKALLGARAESAGRNQEFLQKSAGSYQDFIQQLFREYMAGQRAKEQIPLTRPPKSPGGVSVGGVGFGF